jgi:drug/metabolite transporter (DMT)-like permease
LFRAYDEGKLSVVEVVMLGELPVTIVLGLIFFQETLNISQILVIIMIILGVLLISRTKGTWLDKVKEIFTGKKRIWEKGIVLALVAVSFSSLYNVLTAVNSRNISAFSAVWFPWTFSLIFLFIYIAYKKGFKVF